MKPAKKSLGQNFLIDQNIIRKIAAWVEKVHPESLLEIGPGRGALTEKLVALGLPLSLVEKDHELAAYHRNKWSENPLVLVVDSDFLQADMHQILAADFTGHAVLEGSHQRVHSATVAIGNLPYNVASPILVKLFKHHVFFSDLFLMFQKEVGQRIVAQPGSKDYSLLTLWTNAYTDVVDWFDIPPTVFRPQPKVWSRLIHFKLKKEPVVTDDVAEDFFAWVSKLFQQRRKTLGAVLKLEKEGQIQVVSEGGPLWQSIHDKLQISKSDRAETLGLERLRELFLFLKKRYSD